MDHSKATRVTCWRVNTLELTLQLYTHLKALVHSVLHTVAQDTFTLQLVARISQSSSRYKSSVCWTVPSKNCFVCLLEHRKYQSGMLLTSTSTSQRCFFHCFFSWLWLMMMVQWALKCSRILSMDWTDSPVYIEIWSFTSREDSWITIHCTSGRIPRGIGTGWTCGVTCWLGWHIEFSKCYCLIPSQLPCDTNDPSVNENV